MILERIVCECCGASDWIDKGNTRTCSYCGSVFHVKADSQNPKSFGKPTSNLSNQASATSAPFSISDDIERLLQKCKDDPLHAKRYANLILDIDPNNKEALKYLKGRR